MKKIVLIIAINICIKAQALVDFGATWTTPTAYGPSCLANEYVEVGFYVNFEINNSHFRVQRSTDPNFSWTIYVGQQFNGCGTCGSGQYTVNDYGPFAPNEVWYYRVQATSNAINFTYKDLGSYTTNVPTIVNWISQVTSQRYTGNSPATENSYNWTQESRNMQGVTISMMPTEISKIYLEQNNHKINFSVQPSLPYYNLDVSIDNGTYFNLYNGSGVTGYIWQNASSYFINLGNYNLKVKFTAMDGTIYIREYDVYVVQKSDAFFVDNYCNTMRVWKGNDPLGGTPLVFSEGFDAYNTKSEQYYRQAGNDLINCLLTKGFDVYVVNYNLNAQSIINNGAVFQSAIRYVSSINSNRSVVATGMSMGGVINRYACAKAENDGNPLPISKFLTIDAPHQGAVISQDLQDWRKTLTVGDVFAEHASNNDAAKELLNYNAYDPTGTIHTNFYNYLNSLNTDGYPHLVEKIGVSFSTNLPNPNSGKWLYVNVTGVPGNNNKDFYLSAEELVAGSFLPSINTDPVPVYSSGYWALINIFRSFSNPMATVIQYSNPSFISHNSSLDIINGVSKFDKTIVPANTGYHDVVPADIIQPLVNAIIGNKVYIQNKTYTTVRSIIANQTIFAGNNVNVSQLSGNVVLSSGSNIIFRAGVDIQLQDGFIVNSGAEFIARIQDIVCDGNSEFQNKKIKQNAELFDETTLKNDNNVNFYPNPTKDNISVSFTSQNAENIVLKLEDLMGKQIVEKVINTSEGANNYTLNLSALTNGLYILKIEDNKGKIIKNGKIVLSK